MSFIDWWINEGNFSLELNLNFPYQILYGGLITLYLLIFYLTFMIKDEIKERG